MKIIAVFVAGIFCGGAGAIAIQTATGSKALFQPAGAIRQTERLAPTEVLKAAFANADADTFSKAKQGVKAVLTDPDSAQFDQLRHAARGSDKFVCGFVNAKNKFGGYVGRAPFAYDVTLNQAWIVGNPEDAYLAGEYNLRPCYPDMRVPKNVGEIETARKYPALWQSGPR